MSKCHLHTLWEKHCLDAPIHGIRLQTHACFQGPTSFSKQSISYLLTSIYLSFCSKYWPLFLLFFYILSPIPYCISRRVVDDTDSASNACKELAIFLTTGIVISAFGLPIVFARAEVVSYCSFIGAQGVLNHTSLQSD